MLLLLEWGCQEKPSPGWSATGRVGGEKEKWNGNKLERKAGWRASYTREIFFQGFHTSKVGSDMPFPAAHCSRGLTALPRAMRNKSERGHSDARPPQVIIAVLPIWKINTQNTWKPRLQHCTLLNNSPRWKVIKLEYPDYHIVHYNRAGQA